MDGKLAAGRQNWEGIYYEHTGGLSWRVILDGNFVP
jgi:hypothetical protein